MNKSAMKWTAMAGGLVVVGSVWAVSQADSTIVPLVQTHAQDSVHALAGDAAAPAGSAHATATLEQRLAAVERRVETLSDQLLKTQSHLLELQRHQLHSNEASAVSPSTHPPREQTDVPAAPEKSDPQVTSPYEGLPDEIARRLSELHPEGRIVERGRDQGDGYWWFEIRSGRQLFDVEITEQGDVRKNRPVRG